MDLVGKEIFEIKEWILGKYVMNKVPEDRRLKTLLDGYTKVMLMELSDENGFEAQSRWKKDDLVDYVEERILANLEERLIILGKENLQVLQKKVEGSATDSRDDMTFDLTIFPAATRMGILFSFEHEDEIEYYVPDEIKVKLTEMVSDSAKLEKKYVKEIRVWKEVEDVMHAGLALYGVASKGTIYKLCKVYDTDIEKDDIERQLSFMSYLFQYLPLLAMRNNFYIIRGYLLASDMIEDEEEAERFYFSLMDYSKLGLYEPTKGELNEYVKHSFDRRSTAYKKLKRVVSKQDLVIPFHRIMRYIETNIMLGKKLSELIEDFREWQMLDFRSLKDMEKFVTYYTDLQNHSRMWQLRGHTPAEVRKMMDDVE